MKIQEISKKEFDAVCYARNAHIMPLLREIKFYKEESGSLYGVIAQDLTDGDFGGLVLGRDADKRFRAVEVPDRFYDTPEEALVELEQKFATALAENTTIHPQGDETGKPNELYSVVAKDDKIHRLFLELSHNHIFDCAKAFIGEAVYAYTDIDGNYIKDFQSTGFNARLWELYLYIFLKHQGFELDSSFRAPDYLANKRGNIVSLEATTVNADANLDMPPPKSADEIQTLIRDYMPIKFGSPLYSKLQKEYWNLPHVKGRPLIIAIHDYHMGESLYWAQKALRNYLYGCRFNTIVKDGVIQLVYDGNGNPIPELITEHNFKHKKIPSNFFAQPGSENISAVLYCNNATIDTFNRYGKRAKMGNYAKVIHRISEINDLESPSYAPKIVEENIDDKNFNELWEDTMCLFHNPSAKFPVHPGLFSGMTQCNFDHKASRFFGPRNTPEILRSYNQY
jgi:hypothetical protein